MSKTSLKRIDKILNYLNDHGESKTLKHFKLKEDTLRRYKDEKRFDETKNPKILILDIETAPILAYSWGLWKQNINTQQIESDWFCISWSAKWLFDSEVKSDVLKSKEAKNGDDKRIVQSMWKWIDQADLIITQNGDRFDMPRLNTRFLIHGILPPSPYQSIDTLKILKKNFSFSSNKLDYVNQMLGLTKKLPTGFDLWRSCVKGDEEALATMVEYNRNDVVILEETFLKLRPWMKVGVNMALYTESTVPCCYACGSHNLTERGYYYTSVSRFQSFVCDDCGAYSRSRVSDLSKEHKKVLLSPTAR